MENVEKSKIDLRKLNILGGTGLLLLGLKYFLPASFLVGLVGLVLEAVVMYRYSKILKNPKIWKAYLLYLVGLYIDNLILIGFKGMLDKLAKISTDLVFGLIALIVITTMLFYRKAYKELGLSMRHNYFVKAADIALSIVISIAIAIFLNPNNPYTIDVGVYLGQFVIFIMFAIGYFTAPKELYLEEKKEEIKSEVNKYETNQLNFAELRDDEPILVIENNFTLKAILLKLLIVLLTALLIIYTYKAFTDPSYFKKDAGWERVYYILLIFGIPISITYLILSLTVFNFKHIQVYKNKIIQKSFIKWLPPFDKVVNLDQENLKIKISFNHSMYYIVLTECDCSSSKNLFSVYYCKFFCPKKISVNLDIERKSLNSCSSKSKILNFIDLLLEKIKEAEDREKLEKLKQEVLKWKVN